MPNNIAEINDKLQKALQGDTIVSIKIASGGLWYDNLVIETEDKHIAVGKDSTGDWFIM